MFCKNCGKELSNNAFVCPNCGEPASQYASQTEFTATLPANLLQKTANAVIAILGFVGSLISVACWCCYLATILCGYAYHAFIIQLLGIETCFISTISLFLSIVGILSKSNSQKNRAFEITGTVLSATFLTAFLLLTCIIFCS